MAAPDELDDLLLAFEDYLREERMRGAETVKRYGALLRDFTLYLRGARPAVALRAVTHREVTGFLRGAATANGVPSPTSWNLALAAVRAFFGYLNRKEILMHDPTAHIERHKIASREAAPLTLEEFVTLLDAAEASHEGARNTAIVQVLFHTALRVRELVSLDLSQVDWDARILRDVHTKGAKWLSAPFNDMVAASLQAYLAARQGAADGAGPVFVSNRGTRLSVRSVQDIVKSLGEAAGIGRPVTPHLLRHSSATELVELGTSIRVVQDVCGHASVVTTERYVHVRAGAKKEAVDALGRRVASARTKRLRAA